MKSQINSSAVRSHSTTSAFVTKERSVRIEASRPAFTLSDLRHCPGLPSRAPASLVADDPAASLHAIRDLRAIMRNFYTE